MKILVFSTAYYPHVGGAEVAIKEITDRLTDDAFDLICARIDKALPNEETVGRVTVHRVGPGIRLLDKLWLPFGGALLARKLHAVNRYDAFWAMMVTFGSGAAYLANAWFKTNVPIILTLQEGDSEARLRWRWLGLINAAWRAALKRTARVTAISTYLARRAKRFGWEGEVALIPNGVDVSRFTREYPAEEIDAVKAKLGKRMGDVFLVTASRLSYKNGIDTVIRALPLLPENVRFIILGTGELESSLKALARKLRVERRVSFVGHVDHGELPKYLHACDMFIRPSRSEGMGNSFIEAFAAGLPVIATQEGGIADFLFDETRNPNNETTGWAVDRNDPKSVAAAVANIMVDAAKVRRVTAVAKTIAVEKYDWNLIAPAMREQAFAPVHK